MSKRKEKRYRQSPLFVGKVRMARVILLLEWSAEAEAQSGAVEAACPVCSGGKPGGTAFDPGWYGHAPSCELGAVCAGVRAMKGVEG